MATTLYVTSTQSFAKTRFHQEKKIQHFENLLSKFMDFEALYKALGITKKSVE